MAYSLWLNELQNLKAYWPHARLSIFTVETIKISIFLQFKL